MVTASMYMGKGLRFLADRGLTSTNYHSCNRCGEHSGVDQTYFWLIGLPSMADPGYFAGLFLVDGSPP